MKNAFDLRERVLPGLESLRALPHVPGDYLSFRTGLFRAQLALFDALPAVTALPRLPLGPGSLTLAPELLARMIAQASEPLAEDLPARAELIKLAASREILPELILAASFGPDPEAIQKSSRELGIAEDALLFFGRACGAPYVSKIVWDAPEESVDAPVDSRTCPFCGSGPGLSILRGETGRRFLACSLCGREWEFPRMKCPSCAKDGALDILRESESAPRWIEICDTCRGYLKCADERKLGPGAGLIPLVESISTLYLDLIAEKHGCIQALPYVALR